MNSIPYYVPRSAHSTCRLIRRSLVFGAQEAKPYKNDPEILAMTNLLSAYMNNEIREFEKILKQNSRSVMGDPFIKQYIDDVLKNIRTQVLIVYIYISLYLYLSIYVYTYMYVCV